MSTTVVKHFSTLISEVDKSASMNSGRRYISKASTDYHYLSVWCIWFYGALHPTRAESTFFFGSNGIFTQKDHNIVHKTHIFNFKSAETFQCMSLAMVKLK